MNYPFLFRNSTDGSGIEERREDRQERREDRRDDREERREDRRDARSGIVNEPATTGTTAPAARSSSSEK